MTEHSFESVVVDLPKLRDYCLSEIHPRGRHKARVFRSSLGLSAGNAELLRQALTNAVHDSREKIQTTNVDQYGQRYLLDFVMTTPAGTAMIRSTWIVLTGENMLKLTSCYVL